MKGGGVSRLLLRSAAAAAGRKSDRLSECASRPCSAAAAAGAALLHHGHVPQSECAAAHRQGCAVQQQSCAALPSMGPSEAYVHRNYPAAHPHHLHRSLSEGNVMSRGCWIMATRLHACAQAVPAGTSLAQTPISFVRSYQLPGTLRESGMRVQHFTRHMATVKVVVPSMGESMQDGSVAAILKGPGDKVEADDIIAQVETDKVTIDVRSPEAGVVKEISVKSGDTVTPGTVVATVSSDAEASTAAASPAEAAEGSDGGAKVEEEPTVTASGGLVSALVPNMGESVSDGVVAALLKGAGDSVELDEVIAQIETDKVTFDVRSPEAGVIERVEVAKGATVEPGSKVAVIRRGAQQASTAAKSAKPAAVAETAGKPAATPAAAPKPAQAAASTIQQQKQPAAAPSSAPSPPPPPSMDAPQLIPHDRERRVPMTRLRRRVAQRLKDSQNTFALLTTFNEVDMTNLMALRNAFKDEFFEKHGVKLGFMSAFVKAAANALKQEPVINAVIDGDDVIYRDYIDISIAVGTPKGLVVPVIRKADELSFAEVEKTIAALGKKAKEGTISIDDMAGGTFTISNGGVYGSLISTPIINPPQSAILGMHAVQQRPMVVGKDIVARPMMYVALTYDHRLIDGREAVLFLRRIKDVVEDPRRLLLDV